MNWEAFRKALLKRMSLSPQHGIEGVMGQQWMLEELLAAALDGKVLYEKVYRQPTLMDVSNLTLVQVWPEVTE